MKVDSFVTDSGDLKLAIRRNRNNTCLPILLAVEDLFKVEGFLLPLSTEDVARLIVLLKIALQDALHKETEELHGDVALYGEFPARLHPSDSTGI